MSETALVWLFVLAAASEVAGVVLVVVTSVKAKRSLSDFRTKNPRAYPGGSYGQVADVSGKVEEILGHLTTAWWGVALLLLGIGLGLVANLLSLSA